MLLTLLHSTYLVSYSYQINFPRGGGEWVGGLITEIKAKSASQQSWSWGLVGLGKYNGRAKEISKVFQKFCKGVL